MAKKAIRVQKTRRVTTRRFAPTTERHEPEIKLVKKPDSVSSDYTDLLNAIYDAIVITTLDGQIIDANDRTEQFFRYDSEELKSMNVTRLISRAGSSLLKTLQRNIESQKYTVIHANCVRKNHSHFASDVAVSLIPIGDDSTGLCFSFRDVTKRKIAEEQLNTEHNAIMNASTGIVITDEAGRIQYANPAFYDLGGYEDSGVAITELKEFWADPDEFTEVLEVTSDGSCCGGEMLARTQDGDTFPVEASIAPNRNSQGEQEGLVCSFSGIAERKKAEEALAEANKELLEATKSKARLDTISALAYEINNPLQILLSMVEMDQKPDYRKQLERILEVITKLQRGDLTESADVAETLDTLIAEPTEGAGEQIPCDQKQILVVDDESSLRAIFGQLIETFLPELTVSYAENGREAVEQFQAIKPAVMIMDLAMPELNGEDAHQEIEAYCEQENVQRPSIIFCTGFVPSQKIHDTVNSDDLHVMLTKPIGKNDLFDTVKERLAQPHFAALG